MDKVLKYLSFRGRANRKRFWMTSLALLGLYLVMALLTGVMMIVPLLALIPLLGIVALAVANLANAARRLHDRNKSAWWLLLFEGAPFLLSGLGFLMQASVAARGIGTPSASTGVPMITGLLTLIELPILIWAFVELGCLRGTVGPNSYGDDPLQPAAEVFA